VKKLSLIFNPGGERQAEEKESLLNAAWRWGIPLEAPCGGQGWCGRCRVRIDPAPEPSEEDRDAFSSSEIAQGWRLACRTRVSRPAEVTLPSPSSAVSGVVVPSPAVRREARAAFGIAVDVGTTTLAAQLWDTGRGRLLASATKANPQSVYGADIISRISFSEAKKNLRLLSSTLRRGLNDLFRDLAREGGVRPSLVASITVAGNTTMQHFLAGADPSSLAVAPFRPVFLRLKPQAAARLGLTFFRRATVTFVPCASSFVGGDAVGGALSLHPGRGGTPSLLIDMGTNAELVLMRERSFVATSAAAGPALEGGALSCGMQAVPGAVEEAGFDGDLTLRTIGGKKPRGICGSGLIDLVALLLRFGLLRTDGRLLDPAEAKVHPWKKLAARLRVIKGRSAFLVTESRGPLPRVALTQDDIRELQLAFSAVTTAWELLLRKTRLDTGSIRHIFITGGFGYSLRPENLAATGLIPASWRERITVSHNASLSGASHALLDPSFLKRAREVSGRMKTWHLAETREFRDLFIHNLSFPSS
jgi:uncharacterized 2Fe-2S/4Fe-4S cluster protein (DUF4445 family)